MSYIILIRSYLKNLYLTTLFTLHKSTNIRALLFPLSPVSLTNEDLVYNCNKFRFCYYRKSR